MNALARAASAYYRVNVRAWDALRRSRINRLPVLIAVYLAITLGLNFSGHTEAALIATVALGPPLLAVGWTR
jgi:hypothetical protein